LDAAATGDRVARVEGLLEEVDALADPVARETAEGLVSALVELYGEGLSRVMGAVAATEAHLVRDMVCEDELVAHLLFLHDLHPVALETRVNGALDGVRPYLESHGGGVELLAIEDGVVRLRLQGSCSGCPSSTMTLKLAIEDAIHKAAPDVEEIQAEGVAEPAPAPLLKLEITEALGGGVAADGFGTGAESVAAPDGFGTDAESVAPSHGSPPPEAWTTAGSLAELSGGGKVVKQVTGEPLLFIRLEGDLFAYRPACPGCEESLEHASLRVADLTCSSCGRTYDVIRAGRCLDEPRLHLEPVPLLLDDTGLAKVAIGTAVA